MSGGLLVPKSSAQYQVCSRCIYDSKVLGVYFDESGVCNLCRQTDSLAGQYGTGTEAGESALQGILRQIQTEGIKKPYDCIVGVSGGTDSSYLVHLAVKWGLRPLAVHYDNTWNSAAASMNIAKVLSKLGVDLETYVVHNKEADDIFRSFFLAGVPELEASTDLGYAYLLRLVAKKYGLRFVLEGHSFIEEGITPLGANYFDGRYIRGIHRKYGSVRMKTYPLMTFTRFLRSIISTRLQFVRPFWYLNYEKKTAQEELRSEYGWEYYGGHHLENRMTAFLHTVYLPEKFGLDMRNNTLAANVRNGHISHEAALSIYKEGPSADPGLVEYFRKRLGFDAVRYDDIMSSKPRYWREFRTYKGAFELLSPLFFIFAKRNLVPMSFYLKYCARGVPE